MEFKEDVLQAINPLIGQRMYQNNHIVHELSAKIQKNPDEVLLESKRHPQIGILSLVQTIRDRVPCINEFFSILGVLIFINVALFSFIFMLPMMIWIFIGFCGMLGCALFTILLRQICPNQIYHIFIDLFHIPHSKD